MSDIAELRNRLVVVEDQVARLIDESAATRAIAAMADRDVADHRQEMRGHTRVLNALRQTQIEQGGTLSEHGRMLSEHSQTLAEHGRMLSEHSQTLAEHGRILSEHTRTLDQHGHALGTLVAGQAAIMRHFGIEADDDERLRK